MSITTHTLLGTLVGDAYGLKTEGLPRPSLEGVDWQRGPFAGRALISDDTEQSFFVGQCLLRAKGDVEVFRRALKWRLVGWLFAGPPGVGLGTARSILKLAFGFSSGVRTAGNGAAMRSAIIGAAYATDPEKIAAFVRASTDLTHRDERAYVGALAVALAAGAHVRGDSVADVLDRMRPIAEAGPQADLWADSMVKLGEHLERGAAIAEYAEAIGCGQAVSGFVYHTAPVALFAWARYNDPEEGLRAVWECGGDTDTVGAIAGGLMYAKAGRSPRGDWLGGVADWPLSVDRVRDCGDELARDGDPVGWAWFAMPLRNLVVFPFILVYALVFMMPRKYLRG